MNEKLNILKENNFNFKKKFGQNFITDNFILDRISNVQNYEENSLIIEIGPGMGTLTEKLLQKKNVIKVIAYEIDNTLKPILEKRLKDYPKFKLIMRDFLNRDVLEDIKDENYNKLYICANLPYYITTPIITKIIESDINAESLVLMVQKEVAQRLCANVNSKSYNSLSIFVNYHYNCEIIFDVNRENFTPNPNVDSSIIKLSKKNPISINDKEKFFNLVKIAFTQKRKNLRNNFKGLNLEKIETILKTFNKDLTYRAEQITIEEFAKISNKLN
ncbi:MAG: 16S rRNA (adenine(1518)-N(6)/adenine(1519)-N(6))-dimethyltransferase RsmA [Bacilli bacterium]